VHCAVLATFCRAHVDSDAKNSSGMTLACNLWARVALNIGLALYCACETIVELATKAVTVRLRMHVADGDEADAHH